MSIQESDDADVSDLTTSRTEAILIPVLHAVDPLSHVPPTVDNFKDEN